MSSSIRVSHRLLIGFAALLLVCLAFGGVFLGTAWWQGTLLDRADETAGVHLDHAAGMTEAAQQAYNAALLLSVASPGLSPGDALRDIDGAIGAFAQHLDAARQTTSTEADRSRLSQIAEAFGIFESRVIEHAVLAQRERAPDALAAPFDGVREAYVDGLQPLLGAYATAGQSALRHQISSARAATGWSRQFATGGILLLILTFGVIALVSTRHIAGGLKRNLSAARGIATGELTNPIRVASEDEFGEITEALNDIVVQLASTSVSKTYVENIVHNMADPLVVVDSDVCISMVNPALLELLGYESRELLSASVTKIFAHAGRGRGAAIKRDIERGLSGNVESTFRTRNGGEIPVSLSSAVVRANGQIQGLVLVAKDISALKKREEDLISARDEAERMVQLRDAFLANMSHEIRTPLTGILGSAQILAGVVEGEHKKLALIIEDAGNRLLDTINSVLEMARIEAGEVQPEMEILNLVAEAEAVAAVLRPVAQKKGLAISVEPPARGHVAAQLDRSCLNRILNNLIGNAIKFTDSGSIAIGISAEGDDAVVTVRDTGIGIAKEFIPHLFDDFKQESTGLKRSHEGTGLGLAITRKLVDMMGGTIEVDSVKGLGSTFSVRFEMAPYDAVVAAMVQDPPPSDAKAPAVKRPRPTAVAPSIPLQELVPKDILLIEDNQQNAYMARFMLEGYDADIATTPEDAIDLARQFAYRVLLIDINLGGDISGIDVLETLRKDPRYVSVPAVAVTAYALPGDRERFLQAGFDDYVSKPYRRELLQAAVESALEAASAEAATMELEEVLDTPIDVTDDQLTPVAADAAPEHDEGPEIDYPVASPDEFLPSTFRPDAGAFTETAASVVQKAEHNRKSTDPSLRNPALAPDVESVEPAFLELEELYASRDSTGGSGPRAGRPTSDPR